MLNELKMELFDVIAKAKQTMDINSVFQETETIYTRYQQISRHPLELEADIKTVMSSYCLMPHLAFKDRFSFTNGMIFHTEQVIENKNSFNDMDGYNQLCYEYKRLHSIVENKEPTRFGQITDQELDMMKLGVAMAINLHKNIDHRKTK